MLMLWVKACGIFKIAQFTYLTYPAMLRVQSKFIYLRREFMTGIVFLRNSMILISSLIVRLLLIVFSLARYIVKRFSKIMLMVCVCSIRRRRIRQGFVIF